MNLNKKILLVTIAILLLVLSFSSFITINHFRENYTKALLTGSYALAHSINSILNEMLALGLPLQSLSGMDDKLLEMQSKNSHIHYIGIADLNGKVIFHTNKDLNGKVFNDMVMREAAAAQEPLWQLYHRFDGKKYYDVAVPVFDGKQHIALIRLGFLTTIVDDKVNEAVVNIVLNALLTFIFIAFLLNIFLVKYISRPIREIKSYALKLTNRHFDQPLQIHSGDEIGTLAKAVNLMASTLKKQFFELEKNKEELEKQVQQRTCDLDQSNQNLLMKNQQLIESIAKQKILNEKTTQSENKLKESEERFRTIFEHSADPILLIEDERFIDCNQASVDMLKAADKSYIINKKPSELSPKYQPDGQLSADKANKMIQLTAKNKSHRFEWTHTRLSNEEFPLEVSLTQINYQGKILYHTVWRDITAKKEAEEQIHNLAFYDPLTNLANRRLFIDRVEHAMLSTERSHEYGALILLDLDHFKKLNDTLGHDVGDELLILVAERLMECVRKEDTISRLGGDEFIVLLENLGKERDAAILAAEKITHKIRESLLVPYMLRRQSEGYLLSSSFGLNLFQGQQESIETLMKHTDVALYQAKESGRNVSRFFNPEMQESIESRLKMEKALHYALKADEFDLFYQPQLDINGKIIGAESLIRWKPEGKPLIRPDQFIPIAEETGLIISIGEKVLLIACLQLKEWSKNPQTDKLTISVNVSARQFLQPNFVSRVKEIIQQTSCETSLLKLEITESVVLSNVDEVIDKMMQIKDLGVSFSLDDFGTGYSSLSYLKRLPIDQVKIDRSFVRDIMIDINDAEIVKTILLMAQTLSLSVVSEGVETYEQFEYLKANGCEYFQGYLFGKPEPIETFHQLLKEINQQENE